MKLKNTDKNEMNREKDSGGRLLLNTKKKQMKPREI